MKEMFKTSLDIVSVITTLISLPDSGPVTYVYVYKYDLSNQTKTKDQHLPTAVKRKQKYMFVVNISCYLKTSTNHVAFIRTAMQNHVMNLLNFIPNF